MNFDGNWAKNNSATELQSCWSIYGLVVDNELKFPKKSGVYAPSFRLWTENLGSGLWTENLGSGLNTLCGAMKT